MVRGLISFNEKNMSYLFLAMFFSFLLSSIFLIKLSQNFLVVIALLSILFFLFLNKKEVVEKSFVSLKPFYIALFLYWLVHVLSILIINKTPEQLFTYKIDFLHFLILLPLIGGFLTRLEFEPDAFFKLIILVACLTLFYNFFIIYWDVQRDAGLLETPISRGNMGMLIGLLAYVSFYAVSERKWKVLALVGFLSGVTLSILSGSRGGWLALFLALFTSYLLLIRGRSDIRVVFLVMAIIIAPMIVFWSSLPIADRIGLAISDVQNYMNGDTHTSLGLRFEAWKASYYAFLDKPIFGWGIGSFNQYMAFYNHLNYTDGQLIGHAHNDVFLFMGEMGVLGLASLLSVILVPAFLLIKAYRASTDLKLKVLVLMGLVLIESIFEFSLSDQTFTMRYQFQLYVVLLLIIFILINKRYALISGNLKHNEHP